MKTEKALALVFLGVGTAYLVWRLSEAQRSGGPLTFVSPLQIFQSGNPSTAGTDGGGSSNPFSELFHNIGQAFKMPGNAPSLESRAASRGTSVNPVGPPDTVTLTAQPERMAFLGEDVEYAPNLGDPNFSAWDYLASTPPDLAWDIRG